MENLYTPDCLRTHTGQYVNLLDPQLETIMPFDIAIGLARSCRFGGHTKKFYSVAEHSYWCMHQCELMYPGNDALAFRVLMHDAHEFILCYVPSPLKRLIPEYDHVAEKLQNVIHRRFGISIGNSDREIIATIDKMALEWEWENKVLKTAGFEFQEKEAADLFIHHFVRLCKVPHVVFQ